MLESPRLRYETLHTDHARLLFPVFADPELWRFITAPPPASLEELAQDFARKAAGCPPSRPDERWINYIVRLRSDEACIGHIQATLQGDVAEIGYVFGATYWGQGYATEGLQWLHTYLQEQTGARSYWASVLPTNERSIALLRRLGYQRTDQDWPALVSHVAGDLVFRHDPLA